MEQESREDAGASRSQHVVHLMARSHEDAAPLLAGPLERGAAHPAQLRVLVAVPSADDAVTLARWLSESRGEATPKLVPVTSVRRAKRMLEIGVTALAGTPSDLLALLAASALKLADVDSVALIWVDELARPEHRAALEALLSEVPREAERIAVAASSDESLDEFFERFMWRARRVVHEDGGPSANVALRYLVVVPGNRDLALRSILDAFDPETAQVLVFTDESESSARHAIAALGYGGDRAGVRVTRGEPTDDTELLVLFDEVPHRDLLREIAAHAKTAVAFVPPSRVAHFRSLAGAESSPLQLGRAFQSARAAEDAMRDELQGVVRSGVITSQVLQLEPLCAEHEPVEVAAAALYLLQKERQRARSAAVNAPPPPSPPPPSVSAPGVAASASLDASQRFTRVYVNVGERDSIRRRDLVGAITGEAGIVGTQIGHIELRDTHALVEIASDVAARVIERLTGTSIRGRRVLAREDREKGGASRGRGREERPARRHTSKRPRRDESEGGRAPKLPGDSAPLPRVMHEADEWTERSERLRNSRRGERHDQ